MKDSTKKMLKKIFPLGFLIFMHRLHGSVANKFRYPVLLKNWREFKQSALEKNDQRFILTPKNFSPILHEMANLQYFDRHYVYHPAWAARKVKQIQPEFHVDISSTLHFCSIVSAFIPVKFYDYRPADLRLSNLESLQADLMKLPFPDNSVSSISCMHTVEHVGLGRYGDPVNATADLRAMEELGRVVKKGGNLLFVVPVGKPKLMFNAQRIYSFEQIISGFKDLKLKEFTLLPDSGSLIENASPDLVRQQVYGCGCFWFTKE